MPPAHSLENLACRGHHQFAGLHDLVTPANSSHTLVGLNSPKATLTSFPKEWFEERFEDSDCSGEGFEGIRSQDILPLLKRMFHFEYFFGFANVIDPFVDRAFGYDFDANEPWVRRLIDEIHARDEAEQLAGKITSTHMLAIVT